MIRPQSSRPRHYEDECVFGFKSDVVDFCSFFEHSVWKKHGICGVRDATRAQKVGTETRFVVLCGMILRIPSKTARCRHLLRRSLVQRRLVERNDGRDAIPNGESLARWHVAPGYQWGRTNRAPRGTRPSAQAAALDGVETFRVQVFAACWILISDAEKNRYGHRAPWAPFPEGSRPGMHYPSGPIRGSPTTSTELLWQASPGPRTA